MCAALPDRSAIYEYRLLVIVLSALLQSIHSVLLASSAGVHTLPPPLLPRPRPNPIPNLISAFLMMGFDALVYRAYEGNHIGYAVECRSFFRTPGLSVFAILKRLWQLQSRALPSLLLIVVWLTAERWPSSSIGLLIIAFSTCMGLFASAAIGAHYGC